jgi:CspA family cold shock protein
VIAAHCAPAATGDWARIWGRDGFPKVHQKLAKIRISCCNPFTIGIWPFDCAFREDSEIQQTTGSPFVAWHVKAWLRLFFVQIRRQAMPKGTVKWFNPTKGYGFIKPNGSDKDVFVHISAVERAGLSTLNENQVVEYDLVENRGKSSAENLKVS